MFIKMGKQVYKFSTTGELIGTYKTLADAAKSVGVSTATISMVCRGKRNTAAGFIWSFNNKVDVAQIDEEKEWRDIKGYEGVYQMSEDREVRKLPTSVTQTDRNGKEYTRIIPGKILDQYIDAECYLSVTLNRDRIRIHWLYYNTFIGDSTGYLVDHIDRNRLNNDRNNLRLLTYKGNVHNRTLPYRPDIQYINKMKSRPYHLRFSENGVRKSIGYYATYDEAENKYRELYNERQKRIDDSSN